MLIIGSILLKTSTRRYGHDTNCFGRGEPKNPNPKIIGIWRNLYGLEVRKREIFAGPEIETFLYCYEETYVRDFNLVVRFYSQSLSAVVVWVLYRFRRSHERATRLSNKDLVTIF